ncbi:GNAT family N-acetyltransferase [Paenibacillus ginsengarvi]|uniref:GNAT family N-acetyltransferase n=2 Tax=Paenibacillus ginsengarvi TaxID=400777 RepID=A0A3B0CE67_9BACL|nr:GNAT family N-acetyltransferase [Paenibacillus ginsengarvi]
MLSMRKVNRDDHEFLVRIDLKNDGYTESAVMEMSEAEKREHENKIMSFLVDEERGGYVIEDTAQEKPIAMILYAIANRDREYPWKTIYSELDRSWFQEDGRFLEVFNLWVHPDYRRTGLATQLKRKLDEEAERCGVNLIYTHTEERNLHVVELNEKLGYRQVRRGPIWDDVVRISLIKQLSAESRSPD